MSERCQGCGDIYDYVYRAPNHVWKQICPALVGQYEEHLGGGLLCIKCADERARALGICLYFDGLEGDWRDNRCTDAPEVGLPEGFIIRELQDDYAFVVSVPRLPGYCVWRDKEPAVYALLEAIKPLWLESAGEQEQSGGEHE